MLTQTVTINQNSNPNIIIGRRSTYETQQVIFDVSWLVQTYGEGTAELLIKRPKDASAYPVVAALDGNTLTWTVSDTDTQDKGHGECEIYWYVNGGLAKSCICGITILRDIGDTTETAPDPYETWVDELARLGAETLTNAQAAAQSANDAAQSASEADNSAAAALESEENALNSENAAKASEQAAAASEQGAEQSASAAESSASDAQESADNSSASADRAEQAAASIEGDTERAEAAAQTAQGAATSAQGSASTASTKATEAAGSAASAEQAANTATQKAADASASATAAAGSASSASASATAAGNAKAAAETAQGKAEDAQEAAETAAQSIEDSAAQITQNAEDILDLKSAFDEIAEETTVTYDFAWINGSYLDKGVVKPYNGWRYTEYVLIRDAKAITFTTTAQTSGAAIYNDWYDSDKQYISSFSTFGTTLEVPQNAKFFRLSCRTTETNTASYAKTEVIGLDDKLSADSKQIVDLESAVSEILYVSPNLINPEETTDGYYILKSGAISSDYPNSFITNPIAIEKNINYKANKTNIRIRIQNADGDLLTVITEDTLPGTSGVFSYAADAFMIVTDSISNKSNLMVCKAADFPSSYEPYRRSLNLSVTESEIAQSPLNGKKVCWYGDSLIQNNWKDAVSQEFSMTATNCGVGGTKISGDNAASMCQATRINGEYPAQTDPNTGTVTQPVAVPSDAEVIIIGGGTNDWAQNIPLGEKQVQFSGSTVVEDVTTFCQACHVMFRRFHEERPNAKIVVLGTPFALYKNRWTNTYGLLNNLGLSALDYGKALCDVARMWGFFALDYGEYMGINELNAPNLLNPGSDGHLHPSIQTSKDMFARCTIQRLLTIKYLY